MVGFDYLLKPELGSFQYNLITHGADGSLLEIMLIESEECPYEHPAVRFAEQEFLKTYGTQFTMQCMKYP